MNIPKQPTIPPMPIKYTDITINEAIEILQFRLDFAKFKPRRESAADRSMRERHCEALSMAIDALKHLWIEQRVETYSQLGGNNYADCNRQI